MRALLLVDVQNDFMPGGALPVNEGDQIIPIVNDLLKMKFDAILASKDWHPRDHQSFAVAHGKNPGDVIDLSGLEQVLWPVHCVQGTKGADFAPGWDANKVEKVFFKGIDNHIDSYSAFFDNGHRRATGLEGYLKERGIQDLYVAGLATDYCVKYSVVDAAKLGFNVYLIQDGCKAINLLEEDEARALEEMTAAGAHVITSRDIS